MKAGDMVSVFSDIEGRCTRGATSFQGNKVFVGNGVAQMDRSSIFSTGEPPKYVDTSYMFFIIRNMCYDLCSPYPKKDKPQYNL